MANQYDLVIVGAGYAGLMAAKTAGENGLKTALIEMKHDITKLRRAECQMILPMGDGEVFLEETATYDPKTGVLKFVNNDLSFTYDGPHRYIYAFHLYSVYGDALKFGEASEQRKLGDKGKICMAMDKEKVFASLLKQVKAAGVEVFPGTVATDVSKTDEGVRVTTHLGKDFTATFAIAADGANSRMAQVLGVNKDRGYYSSMNVVGHYVKDLKVADPDTVYYVVAQYENTAVITAIAPRPYENEHAVVFICLDCRVDLIKFYKYLTEETKLSTWFKGTTSELVNSSCNNMWSTLEKPYKDNVLLVGDVPFCQESENFGALLSGGLAARVVANAIKSNNPTEEGIKEYLEWWDKAFYNNAHYKRDQVMGNYMLGAILNNEDIGYLFSKLDVTLTASIHPYTLFADLGEALGAVAPEIQKEKPQVLAGLGRMQQESPAEILKDEASAGFPNR
jgi:digeranylgeranylglycerophospholipid reductase